MRSSVVLVVLALVGATALSDSARAAYLSAETDPFAPTALQVDARFQRIEGEIVRLRGIGSTVEADEMARKLQHFRDQLAGRVPSEVAGAELDLVGVNSGWYADPTIPLLDPKAPGSVTVAVRATDRPVVLALTSARPVQWNLSLQPGVQLQKVLVSGPDYQPLPADLPAGVPVELYPMGSSIGTSFHVHYKDTVAYPATARKLHQFTGLSLSSFQGQSSHDGTPINIGLADSEWAAQRVLAEMQPLYMEATAYERARAQEAVSGYRFTAAVGARRQSTWVRTSVSEFSPLGEVPGTNKQLANTRYQDIAVGSQADTYYAAGRNQIYELHPATNTAIPLAPAGSGMTEWTCALTFDTTRNRLVVATLSGEGYLYTYSPEEARWSVLRSLNNVDLESMTYSAHDDSYYGLDRDLKKIHRYNADGQHMGEFRITEYIAQGDTNLQPYQLVSAGDRLALITPPAADLYQPLLPDERWVYLLDPKTGDVTYSGVMLVPEPQGMVVVMGVLWALSRRRGRGQAANAG